MAPAVFSAEGLHKKSTEHPQGPRVEDCFLIDIQLFIHHLTDHDLTFLVGETFNGHAAMVGGSLEATLSLAQTQCLSAHGLASTTTRPSSPL